MTPEQMAEILRLGGMNAEAEPAIQAQMEQAKFLRGRQLPQRSAGRMLMAPSVLESIAHIGGGAQGGMLRNQALAGQQQQAQRQQMQNQMTLKAILAQSPQPTSQPTGGTGLMPGQQKRPFGYGGL